MTEDEKEYPIHLDIGALYLFDPSKHKSLVWKEERSADGSCVRIRHWPSLTRRFRVVRVTNSTFLTWLGNEHGFLFPDGSVADLRFSGGYEPGLGCLTRQNVQPDSENP